MSSPENANSRNPQLEHRHGDHYSGKRKIPTVQKFNEDERRQREQAQRQLQFSLKKGLPRVVRDPITAEQVQIRDSQGDYKQATEDMSITVPRQNLVNPDREDSRPADLESEGKFRSQLKDESNSVEHDNHLQKFVNRRQSLHDRSNSEPEKFDSPISPTSNARREKKGQRHDKNQSTAADEDGWVDIPMRGQRSNILFYTMPDPDFDQHHSNMTYWFMRLPYFIFCCECFRYFILDFGRITSIIVCLAAGYWIKEQMDISWSSTKLETVKRRADQALAKRVPESVEWLNSVVEAVWKQINPEIFTPAVDKLEDIMQASAPGIIHAIKIADLGHGDHAVRLLSMRYLEDKEIEEAEDTNSEGRQAGDFVNVEVTLAYSAKTSLSSAASKVKNMHILIVFYGGLANVLGVPVPIYTEIEGFIATLRLRLQFTPDFPYIKNTTFALMGLPKFDISVVPLSRKLLNISNLPILSTFIKKSIKAALNEYVAPKSYTIDLGSLLVGNGIPLETIAIGVIVVHLHRATGLEAQDKTGLSDPYIVVAMSNYGKPLFSSRIIEKTLNPVFEETCFVLVTSEALRSRERLSIQLWDSDRVSADDENGRVEFDIQDLVAKAGEKDSREDGLVSSIEGRKMSGKLKWTVGYYPKRPCNRDLATDGSDPNLSDDIKEIKDVTRRRELPDIESDKAITYCSPDPDWPSGILRVQIHQAVDLYAKSPHGSWQSDMHYKQGQDTSAPEVEEDEAQSPSAYCNIMLNDQIIYRTRTKPFSNKPFFNAGTERFVRDWRTAACLVSVYDSRTREHDALLGVIPLKLSEVFQNASQISKNYPLIGGLGEGKVKISLLWESMEHHLPKNLLGWDIGNFRITSASIRIAHPKSGSQNLKNMKLKMFSSASSTSIGGRHCHTKDNVISWDTGVTKEESLELPCIRRHSSAVCVEFHSISHLHAYAIAVCWLNDMLDDDPQTLRLKIWRTNTDEKRMLLRQNKLEDALELEHVECLGVLEFDAIFLRGLGACHRDQVRTDSSLRQAHEAWSAAIAYARRNAGDHYLIGNRRGSSTALVAPDPYARLNEGGRLTDRQRSSIADGRTNSNENNKECTTKENKTHVVDDEIIPQTKSNDISNYVHKDMPSEDSRTTLNSDRWDEAWLQDHNLGSVIAEDGDKTQKEHRFSRGSISANRTNRHSVMFSGTTSQTSRAYEKEDDDGEETEVDRHSKRYKKLEKEKFNREQRGSQQFKTFRTLKWAKDGVILGREKLMRKIGRKQLRRPDIESEV